MNVFSAFFEVLFQAIELGKLKVLLTRIRLRPLLQYIYTQNLWNTWEAFQCQQSVFFSLLELLIVSPTFFLQYLHKVTLNKLAHVIWVKREVWTIVLVNGKANKSSL